jgi:hypothetical protein
MCGPVPGIHVSKCESNQRCACRDNPGHNVAGRLRTTTFGITGMFTKSLDHVASPRAGNINRVQNHFPPLDSHQDNVGYPFCWRRPAARNAVSICDCSIRASTWRRAIGGKPLPRPRPFLPRERMSSRHRQRAQQERRAVLYTVLADYVDAGRIPGGVRIHLADH